MSNVWITAGGRMCILPNKLQDFHLDNVRLLWDQLINKSSSSEPATAACSPFSPVNGNHSGISQLNQPASHILHFQFSYINGDVLGTLGWFPISNTLLHKQEHISPSSAQKHTVLYHTKSMMTSFSFSVGESEDILFVKLINIHSFRQLFLYALYQIPCQK